MVRIFANLNFEIVSSFDLACRQAGIRISDLSNSNIWDHATLQPTTNLLYFPL